MESVVQGHNGDSEKESVVKERDKEDGKKESVNEGGDERDGEMESVGGGDEGVVRKRQLLMEEMKVRKNHWQMLKVKESQMLREIEK